MKHPAINMLNEVDVAKEVRANDPCVGLKIEHLADSVKVKHANILSLEDQFTFSIWINALSVQLHQEFFLVIHIANNYALSFGNGFVQVAFRNEKPGWMWKKTSIQLSSKTWTHIAVSYDSVRKQATVMKDGAAVDIIPVKGKLTPNVNHLIIKLLRLSATKEEDASHPIGAEESNSFTAMIAHLRIWKAVLSEQQIKNQLSRPVGIQSPEDEKDLVCWWKFDEGYSDKVNDCMGNAPEGAVTGCSWWIARNATGTVHVPPSALTENMRAVFNNPLSSDLQLTVEGNEGEPIFAHKVILTNRSEAFKAMLMTQMSESSMKMITVRDISFDTLYLILEFLYTDVVELTGKNVVDVFEAADRFQVTRLHAMCENYLIKNIDEDNVISILELSDKVNASQLKTFCTNWILSNYGEVLRKGDYRNLPKHLQLEIDKLVAEQYFPANNSKKRKFNSSGNFSTTVSTNNNAFV